jgi:hypothetical protein
MPDLAYPRLIFRGFFPLRRTTQEDYILSTEYPGGYRDDAIIGAPVDLLTWELSYPHISHLHYIELPNGERKTRFEYLRDFRRDSKINGNRPFVIQDPVDGKDYLAIFADDSVSMDVTKTPEQPMQMATTMLIKQVFVRGVNFLDDGSLGDYTGNAEI